VNPTAAVLEIAKPRGLGNDHPVRVALVGLGGISRFHLLALRRIPWVSVAGGCDSDPRRRDFARSRWGIAAYASIAELLNATRVDVIHILAPPSRHVELGLECLSRGCHIFMEKPMGVTSSECRLLEEAAVAHRCRSRSISLLKCCLINSLCDVAVR
jgi:predicted dehydrogenase